MEITIIDRGRGPEIKGTRITVYDVFDYSRKGWQPNSIALLFGLCTDQILAAMKYIEEHKDEVMKVYQKLLERDAQGNPPEVEARLRESRAKIDAWLQARKNGQAGEIAHEGHSSRQ
jgi:uncharacterized protein (DUF433 family)